MSTITDIIKNSKYKLSAIEFAQDLDTQDKLKQYRQQFSIPLRKDIAGENPILSKQLGRYKYMYQHDT